VGLVGSGGLIATTYTYQPFGATTVGGSASGNSYQFTGRENDATGLYYYRARYYSPANQRFVSQDPIDFLGGHPNLYTYVANSPVNLADPSGEIFGLPPGGIGAIRSLLGMCGPQDLGRGLAGAAGALGGGALGVYIIENTAGGEVAIFTIGLIGGIAGGALGGPFGAALGADLLSLA